MRIPAALTACLLTGSIVFIVRGPDEFGAALPPPGFHHLHLNSTNPEAAIAFYTKQFPSTEKSTFARQPALKTVQVNVLFTKVRATP